MRVTIVGGGLQGVELCWLARKAGWETLLVDSRSAPPALRLADAFIRYDATALAADDGPTREVMDRMAMLWRLERDYRSIDDNPVNTGVQIYETVAVVFVLILLIGSSFSKWRQKKKN